MTAKWIWYPGDFELYHNLLVHSRREEYGYPFPVMWHISRPQAVCCFTKEVKLSRETELTVFAQGEGYLSVDGKRIGALNTAHVIPEGTSILTAEVTCLDSFPAIYLDSEEIVSDENWVVHFNGAARKWAACDPAFYSESSLPSVFPFSYREIFPVSSECVQGGTLYDFGTEQFGPVTVHCSSEEPVCLYYGESREEALDEKWAYLREVIPEGSREYTCRPRAFRFLFLTSENASLTAQEEYLPLETPCSFSCSDDRITSILDICERAFRLNSREFYLDGVKRDRWVWSGDAYQSYMIGRYMYRDQSLTRRTIRALLGRPPYFQHINTINDYSMYLFPAVLEYYEATGDRQFLQDIREELIGLYQFITSRLDEETGYVVARPGDWIFIDWADMDKDGPLCAEQILLYQVYRAMAVIAPLIQSPGTDFKDIGLNHYAAHTGSYVPFPAQEESSDYSEKAEQLKQRIVKDFWDSEKHAFIDTFASGKRNITRHANIFAILYDFADEKIQEQITDHVLFNDAVPQLTTPYFKLFELMALGKRGKIEEVQEYISGYWGGMLDNGATAAWEEYIPGRQGTEHYEMYGEPYGCSLCHAWGSGPVYLLGRYCAGVHVFDGGKQFSVQPNPGHYTFFDAVVPIREGTVEIHFRPDHLTVFSDVSGGTLYWNRKTLPIPAGQQITLSISD